ncbi:uncharacterized protein Eint_040082 [Encephalitozoon intestinalis ATCC 50506]|uniref:Uncharacterized protein n=1 Tax=Encephalitozoon intestinalis (strain ATCC 50506) TaxID=876142 RepID=W8PKE5_ENCIT|nr:uncharacterized protein Eint_040082 [Encephalitozoon intestinalis ATCC 50506]AHL30085.1 hypothetical protein Eint_040082 [Encephalitozoon intestinalis ATCC 50506]UTX44986.1 hypothetical protein GPK93_04g05190 [Encephalitozoon intestinalis]
MEEDESLFDKINEAEMEADIKLAMNNHKIPEIKPIEEFILSYNGIFQNLEELKKD